MLNVNVDIYLHEMIYGSHMQVMLLSMTPVSGVGCVVYVAFIVHVA